MKNENYKTDLLVRHVALFLFFILSAFYLSEFADYIFFYQEKSKLFLASFTYFAEHLNKPGGILVWISEFQTAFYFYPLAGAIIVSLEICLIIVLLSDIGKKMTGRIYLLIPFFTGSILFYLQLNYQYTGINNLAILLQLILFYLVYRFFKGKAIWVPIILFPAWYFLTGSFSLIFLTMFTIMIITGNKKIKWIKLISLYFILVLFLFISKELFFFQTIEDLFIQPFSERNTGNQLKIFAAVILLISFMPLIYKFDLKWFDFKIGKIRILAITPFVVLILFGILAVIRIDKKSQHYFDAEKLFYEHEFDRLIELNKENPSSNILTNFLNNIALAETGRLNDELFQFPQSPDGNTLFLKWELSAEILKKGGYFYYSLGLINEAQRWAYEYMVMRGYAPEGIKMLIKTELIIGNFKVAAKYISILKQSVFYKKEAVNFEKMLFNEAAIHKDAELGRKTQLKTKKDFFVQSENPLANLEFVIAGDSANPIAVQYKFAWLLLQKDFESVTRNLPLLKKAGFSNIPKNIEEAIVAYSLLNLKQYPEFEGFTVNPKTVINFNEYYKIFQQNSGNREKAQAALGKFSDTYWYYVFFR